MHQVNLSWSFWMMKCFVKAMKGFTLPTNCTGCVRQESEVKLIRRNPSNVCACNTDQMLVTNTQKQLALKYAFIHNIL